MWWTHRREFIRKIKLCRQTLSLAWFDHRDSRPLFTFINFLTRSVVVANDDDLTAAACECVELVWNVFSFLGEVFFLIVISFGYKYCDMWNDKLEQIVRMYLLLWLLNSDYISCVQWVYYWNARLGLFIVARSLDQLSRMSRIIWGGSEMKSETTHGKKKKMKWKQRRGEIGMQRVKIYIFINIGFSLFSTVRLTAASAAELNKVKLEPLALLGMFTCYDSVHRVKCGLRYISAQINGLKFIFRSQYSMHKVAWSTHTHHTGGGSWRGGKSLISF